MSPHRDDPKARRHHPRYSVEGVHGSFALSADVEIVDLSLTGVGIETRTYLGVGRKYHLKVDRNGEPVRLLGRVVWSTLVRTERNRQGDVYPVYRAGLRFDDLLNERGEEWLNFVGDIAMVRPERRLVGRFEPPGAPGGALHGKQPFEVRSLSMGGMLVETEVGEGGDELVGSTFPLVVELGEGVFEARGEIIYLRGAPDESPRRREIGVRFAELGDDSRELLAHFIRHELEGSERVLSPADR